jgi:hypothetical protein
MTPRKSTRCMYVFSLLVVLLAVGGAAVAASPSVPVGTWKGRIVQRERTYTNPMVALVVTARGVQSRFSGLTGAAHDSPSATSTCSVPYKLVGNEDGWFYYEQSGPSRLPSPTGAVEGSPCGAPGKRLPGWSGYLLRLHRIRGGKLAVQVTTWDQAPKSLAETINMLKHPLSLWRGYLTH